MLITPLNLGCSSRQSQLLFPHYSCSAPFLFIFFSFCILTLFFFFFFFFKKKDKLNKKDNMHPCVAPCPESRGGAIKHFGVTDALALFKLCQVSHVFFFCFLCVFFFFFFNFIFLALDISFNSCSRVPGHMLQRCCCRGRGMVGPGGRGGHCHYFFIRCRNSTGVELFPLVQQM